MLEGGVQLFLYGGYSWGVNLHFSVIVSVRLMSFSVVDEYRVVSFV